MPPANSKKRKMDSGTKFYAVRAGYKPGVYATWELCQQQISGFKGAQFKSFPTYEDAMAFAAGQDVKSKSDEATRYYAVAIGRTPGVYTSWPQAQEAIVGWKGPKYKRFDTKAEAEAFVRTFGNDNASASASASASAKSNSAIAPLEISSDEDEDEDDILEVQEVARPPAKKAKVSSTTGGIPVIYTDGSSLGNGKAGASAGLGVYFGENDPRNVSERLKGEPQTNQRAELMAILRCLQIIGDSQPAEIRSDSKYSIQCVTEWYQKWEQNGWKTAKGDVKNTDIVKPIRDRLEAREKRGVHTQFVWVKGHATDPGNIAADLLAQAGARMK